MLSYWCCKRCWWKRAYRSGFRIGLVQWQGYRIRVLGIGCILVVDRNSWGLPRGSIRRIRACILQRWMWIGVWWRRLLYRRLQTAITFSSSLFLPRVTSAVLFWSCRLALRYPICLNSPLLCLLLSVLLQIMSFLPCNYLWRCSQCQLARFVK